jgi:FkbM family methyltransferase
MFEKLKKIRKAVLRFKPDEFHVFENELINNPFIEEFQLDKGLYNLNLINNSKLYIRNNSHSDYSVFKQIFNQQEYKLIVSMLSLQKCTKDLNIIDAGANIGLTSIYLSQFIGNSKFYCIEPSEANLTILKKNVESNSISQNKIIIYPNALSHEPNLCFDIENDFRDGLDWSTTTNSNKDGKIKGITLEEIIVENNLEKIDLLKIDIEGAERFIFSNSANLNFLEKTKIIAIEIHDEFNIRNEINSLLILNGFLLFESGELTIGINVKLIGH